MNKIFSLIAALALIGAVAMGQSSLKDTKSQILVAADVMPAGTVIPYAGSTAPNGWILAYGQAVSRTTYSALFTAIGTIYGVGDGSTTFNLPDLRGRAIAGKDNMGGSAANRLTNGVSGITGTTLGAAGGAEAMMQHSHAIDHNHAAVTSGTQSVLHTHTGYNTGVTLNGASGSARYTATADVATSTESSDHTHSVDLPNFTGTSGNSGSGTTQGNVQPTMILNYIIKY